MTTLYGIKNCDTVKKARKWLEANSVAFEFHDFKTQNLAEADLQGWLQALGPEKVVNKRSTTWKQLSDEQKAYFSAADNKGLSADAVSIIIANPTLVKRPVLKHEGGISVGFKDVDYQKLFS